MMTETGTLPLGVRWDGEAQRDFEVRPQLVRDSVEAMEEPRALGNDSYLGVCILARRIVRIGRIPKAEITPGLLMDMHEADMAAITQACVRLEKRLLSFRGEDAPAKEGGSGGPEAGVQPA
jgi:phage FluMu protein gp41